MGYLIPCPGDEFFWTTLQLCLEFDSEPLKSMKTLLTLMGVKYWPSSKVTCARAVLWPGAPSTACLGVPRSWVAARSMAMWIPEDQWLSTWKRDWWKSLWCPQLWKWASVGGGLDPAFACIDGVALLSCPFPGAGGGMALSGFWILLCFWESQVGKDPRWYVTLS